MSERITTEASREGSRVNLPEWTVTELSAALKKTVEDSYGYVRVRAEVSGYRGPHASGHCYFSLKDSGAKIEAVIWKGVLGRMRFKPEEGLEVIATGKLTTFPGQSKYQIVVESLEPAGVGALMALLEERKKKLAAEGLFEEARKQLLPFLPDVIGVVTSPTGAVIRDILHRLSDRFPRRVLVWPVRVQGEGSAAEVANAINGFNALLENGRIPRPDLIIVARGGGSLEDLWSFNEEIVVRAAADSMIPLISAVGHETDVTLIDFASDRRAPTPTAAAEMAVPVRAELLGTIDGLARRALSCWLRGIEYRRSELRAAMRALPNAEALLAIPRQRLDGASERLPRALIANAQVHRRQFVQLAAHLTPRVLRQQVSQEVARLDNFSQRIAQCTRVHAERRRERLQGVALRLVAARQSNVEAYRNRIGRERDRIEVLLQRANRAAIVLVERRGARLERAGQLLNALSHRGVLARGFALVRDAEGQMLHGAAAVMPGTRLDIEFADGHVGAFAAGTPDPSVSKSSSSAAPKPAAPAKPRGTAGGSGQGSLFGA
jgi:exodeoxyribonuclease VII large subunit